MDTMEEYVHHAQDRRPASVFRWSPKGSIHDRCRAADRRIPHDFRRHPARRPPELGRAQKSRGYHACEGCSSELETATWDVIVRRLDQ